MKKIIGTKKISGNEIFKALLKEAGYTATEFTHIYAIYFPTKPISEATVQSWCSGRRLISSSSAITVQHVACILSGSLLDPEAAAQTMMQLINGATIPVYEE